MKNGALIASIILSFMLAIASASAEEHCINNIDAAEVNKQIKFNNGIWEEDYLCKPESRAYKIMESLIKLKNFTLQKEVKDLGKINPNVLRDGFWDYFTQRISSISFEESCEKNILAFVFSGKRDGIMHICPLIFDETSKNVYDRMSIFLHEARHFDGFKHVKCTRGQRAGMVNACDQNIEEKGSYAVSIESYAKMAVFGKNIPPNERARMKNAVISLEETMNEPILPEGFEVIYLSNSKERVAYFFDGKKLTPIPFIPNAKIISRRNSLLAIPFDKSDAYSIDIYSRSFTSFSSLGAGANSYNNLPRQNRSSNLDIFSGANISGYIHGPNIALIKKGSSEFVVDQLPWDIHQVFLSEEVFTSTEGAILVKNSANEFFKVTINGENKLEFSPIVMDSEYKNISMISVLGSQRYVLSTGGDLMKFMPNHQLLPIVELKEKKIFDLMSRAVKWTELLVD